MLILRKRGMKMNTTLQQDHDHKPYVNKFFDRYKIGTIIKKSNFNKVKGFSPTFLFKLIFVMVFVTKTMHNLLQSGYENEHPHKDTIYRFLNSTRYNWRKFLSLLSIAVVESLSILTSRDRVEVLILDDSLFGRDRSKAVELLAKVYDHAEKKYRKGFRMLTLGWSDGTTFIPLNFSLLSSENEKNRINGMDEEIDKRSNGYKRRAESIRKATEVLIDLLNQVDLKKISAKYLLFDSWFAYPAVIKKVMENNLHVICMLKKMSTIYYRYNGKQIDVRDLYKSVFKKCGRAKILASVIVEFGKEQPVKGKIVFVRDRNKKRQWLAILSTDTNVEDEEIVRIYGKRWDIEVFFKMCKSFLNLAKEFQGRSYDSMIAHTTIVFCRYIMLFHLTILK